MYEEKIKKENSLPKTILISSVVGTIGTISLMLIFAAVIVLLQLDRIYSPDSRRRFIPRSSFRYAPSSMIFSFYLF